MAKLFRVLSIDGGGIRGVVPSVILAEIERVTEKPIAKLFDLITGTSSGAILALGLVSPAEDGEPGFTARDGIKLFTEEGGRIFSRSTWHKLRSVWSVEQEKYPAAGIEAVFREYFGNARLKDALTPVMIASYEIERRTPFFFKSEKARSKDGKDHDFPMWQVARAATAAPTFFEPAKLRTDDPPRDYALVDAGIFANNPAMCAFAEARAMRPGADILVASFGTGEFTQPILYEEAKGWGLRQWAQPLFGISFDGTSSTVDYQLKQLLSEGRYFRFQGKLNECNDEMDDASPTNVRALQLLAQGMMEEQARAIDELCRLIT